jgi:hypothetical protein
MKKVVLFLIVLAVCLSCEKSEIAPKEYPFVLMQEVKVSDEGAEFVAEIIDLGDSPILRYGFTWVKGTSLQALEHFSREMESEVALGRYAFKVISDLEEGELYTVRPFIQTSDQLVLGDPMTFRSRGSLEPELYDFSPKKGESGDTITISGANFSLSKQRIQVLLGEDEAIIHSADFQEIKFVVPDQLSVSGEVPLRLKSGIFTLQSDDLFLIEGQQIANFSPKEGIIGETEVVITGSGFLNARNKVRFGPHEGIILEEKETELRVQLPYNMDVEKVLVEVDVNGKVATAVDSFTVRSRWSRLNDFPVEPRVAGYFTVVGEDGYLVCGSRNPFYGHDFTEVWRYHFPSDEWAQLESFPGVPRSLGVGFYLNEKIYFGLGVHRFQRFSDFWEYDISSDTWTRLQDFPGSARYDAIHFTLNGYGYVIGGSVQQPNKEVWQYDASNDSWVPLGSVASSLISIGLDGRALFFQSDDRAFLLPSYVFSNPNENKLYEFAPDNPSFLTELSQTPFEVSEREGRMYAFVIEDEMYIGGDDYKWEKKEGNPEFWKYNLSNGAWTRIESFPGGERTFVNCIAKNGIGYALFGQDGTTSTGNYQNFGEIWTYDPSK